MDLQVNVVLTFTDNTTAAIANVYNNVMRGVEFMELYNVPTGIEDLGIDTWMQANAPTKVLESYTVVMAGGAATTQAFKYVVDYNYVETPRLLYVTNPFGVLEVIACKGIGTAETTIETEKAGTSALSLPATINWKSRRENTMKVNCGFKTKDEMQWLADLLEATRAFEIINDKLVPIVFEKNNLTTVHDLDYLYSATIEYAYTHTETIEQA